MTKKITREQREIAFYLENKNVDDIHLKKIAISLKRHLSIAEMLVKYNFLTRWQIKQLIYMKEKNGLSEAIIKMGRSYVFDTIRFEKWLQSKYKRKMEEKAYENFKEIYNFGR